MTLAIDGTDFGEDFFGLVAAGSGLTTAAADFIALFVRTEGGPVVSVSSTTSSGWTVPWTKRKAIGSIEYWYGVPGAALTGEIVTVTQTSTALIVFSVFGVSGANNASPFDAHAGLPFGAATGNVSGVSTTSAVALLINGFVDPSVGQTAGSFGANAGTGIFDSTTENVGLLTQYYLSASAQSGITVTQTPNDGSQTGGVVDAIVAPSGNPFATAGSPLIFM